MIEDKQLTVRAEEPSVAIMRWTLVGQSSRAGHSLYRCTCGTTREVSNRHVRRGASRSCGCYHREAVAISNLTHGETHAPEYTAWAAMIQRCENPCNPGFHRYGGRGIAVCQEWKDFETFFRDMGRRPSRLHSIDRKDNDGNYEPGNCRWATLKEQSSNRACTRLVDGKPIAVLAQESGIAHSVLYARIIKLGWDIHRALTQPLSVSHSHPKHV